MKMLILTGSPNSYSVKRIRDEAVKRKHEVTIENPVDLMCFVSETSRGHDRVYRKSDRENDVKRMLAKESDVIISRFAGANIFEFGCSVLEHLNGNLRIPSTQWSFGLRIASNKFLSVQAFSQSRVKTPKSIFAFKPSDFGWIAQELGFPLICKTLTGSMGSGVFILNDPLSISTTLGAFSKLGVNLLLQKFINSGTPANDLRVYVVDGKVSAAYRRFALDSDFRSNFSISKLGEKVELSEDQKKLAIEAADAVGLEGCCAVDLMEDKDNNNSTYVIEANGNGNLYGIEKVTGNNVALDIVRYAERIGKKAKDQEAKKQETAALMAQKYPNIYRILDNKRIV